MQAFLQITTENGQYIYTLLYQLSFLIAFLLFIYIGIRKKYPLPSWLLLGAVASVFFIIGSKTGTFSWKDWQVLFQEGYLVDTHSKSLVGGLIMGIAAIFIFKKWLKFQPSVLDAYAIILPVVLIVQRIGCLLAGCCFGTSTTLPWGVEYASHYSITQLQVQEGIIGQVATSSMPVHPIPIYLIGVYLLVLLAIWKTRNTWKKQGSLALFAFSVLFGLRFFVEFFRDPGTNHAMGEILFGLKGVQWLLLLMVAVFTLLLALRERFNWFEIKYNATYLKGLGHHALLTAILIFIVWLGRKWFTTPESLIIHAYLLVVLISLSTIFWQQRKQLSFKFGTLSLLALSLLLMSQTYDHQPSRKVGGQKDKTKTLTVGANQNDFNLEFLEKHYSGEGCDRELTSADTIKISSGFSTAFQYEDETQVNDRNERIIGAGITYSQFKKSVKHKSESREKSIGVNLYYGNDFEYVGYRFGLSLGSFNTITNSKEREDIRGKIHTEAFYPIMALRLGKEDFLFADGSIGADLPYDILYSRYRAGIGIGTGFFDLMNNSTVRVGMAENIDEMVFYLKGDIAVNDFLILQPSALFGKYPVYGIGLSFRF